MTRFFLLLAVSGAVLAGAEPPDVQSVYVLPMSRGLDQYLANRLTNSHLFQVVTDPKLAQAVFTDRIGEEFEAQLEDITKPPKPSQPAKDSKEAKDTKPETKKESAQSQDATASALDALGNIAQPVSAFGRGKGTVFLVDAKSRQVLWSTFRPPKSSSSTDLDRTASDIVSRLTRDLKKK